MRILEAVTFDVVMRHFAQEHPFDDTYADNYNDDAEVNLRGAERLLGGLWHKVLLDRAELLSVVLPWHVGEYGEVELIPPTGLTVAGAADRLRALDSSYARTNPACARKLEYQSGSPRQPVFLSTRTVPGADYDEMTAREGLIHLDGLHRMLAWERSGAGTSGAGVPAYVAGLGPAEVLRYSGGPAREYGIVTPRP
ncbi:DUF6309 family protein [Streptomyces uncialis]|uniref:DUF6309 family protein n=1 Tax=Streptomyces uncialis TaxID=1048205 RepID=UPI00365EC0EF